MGKKFFLILLGILLLAGSACKQEGVNVPDEVLTGLHKPVIKSISPAGVLFNDAGFFLSVHMNYLEDNFYVLYINDRMIGQEAPGYWRTSLGWSFPKALLNELLASSPDGVTCSVRITSINQSYDISDNFEKYNDYVSEPMALEIKKGETQFSTPQHLFPEWNHSSDPVIRCDKQGNLFLAWREKVNGVYQAFFCFSCDAGANWSQVLNISRSNKSIDNIGLAVDDGHFFMTWSEGNEIYFSRSLTDGAAWFLPEKINTRGEAATKPAIDINDRGDIAIAWYKLKNEEVTAIRLNSSRDLGKNWKSRDFAVSKATDPSGEPVLVSGANGDLCLASGKNPDSDSQGFYFFSSSDYGVTWQLQEISAGNIYPFMHYSSARCGPDGNKYFFWGNSSILGHNPWNGNYFLRHDGSGNEWSEIRSFHEICPTNHEKTALSVSAKNVDVVLTASSGLFLLRSTDEGRNWSYPEFIPGTDCMLCSSSPDTVLHPSGKTFLVFIKSVIVDNSSSDPSLYLMQFE